MTIFILAADLIQFVKRRFGYGRWCIWADVF